MSEKIYCKDCRYLVDEPFGYCCEHPNNMITWYSDKVEDNVKIGIYGKDPREINKNNNCTWYDVIKK